MKKVLVVLAVLTGGCITTSEGQTQWSSPILVKSGTDAKMNSAPVIAAGANGTLAAAWIMTGAVTSGTVRTHYPFTRESAVHVSFSEDRGETWKPSQRLSQTQFHCSEIDVDADPQGNFHFLWTSGDVFTGYRFHLATTADLGQSFTSITRTESFTDSGRGAQFVDIESLGSTHVVSWSGVKQDVSNLPGKRYLTNINSNLSHWDNWQEMPSPLSSPDVVRSVQNLASNENTVLAVASVTTSTATPDQPGPRPYIIRSTNGGTTWTAPAYTSSSPMYTFVPNVGMSSNGTSILLYGGREFPSLNSLRFSRLQMQRSTDEGETWSVPVAVGSSSTFSAVRRIAISTDGRGRWLAILHPSGYIWSNDDGITWSTITEFPFPYSHYMSITGCYLGNGEWGLIGSRFNSEVLLYKTQWGPSAVADWTLY